MSKKTRMNDPALFRKMSEPHESSEAAADALEAFCEDIRAAREKHRIKNIVIVSEVVMRSDDGDEVSALAYLACGEMMAGEMLASYAMGYAKREREMLIEKMQAHGKKG